MSDDSLSGPAMAREPTPAPNPPPRRSLGRRLIFLLPSSLAAALAVVLAVGVTTNWDRWIGAAGRQWTDDAYLQADLTPLSAQVTRGSRRNHEA